MKKCILALFLVLSACSHSVTHHTDDTPPTTVNPPINDPAPIQETPYFHNVKLYKGTGTVVFSFSQDAGQTLPTHLYITKNGSPVIDFDTQNGTVTNNSDGSVDFSIAFGDYANAFHDADIMGAQVTQEDITPVVSSPVVSVTVNAPAVVVTKFQGSFQYSVRTVLNESDPIVSITVVLNDGTQLSNFTASSYDDTDRNERTFSGSPAYTDYSNDYPLGSTIQVLGTRDSGAVVDYGMITITEH